ncbi:MAG: CRISPR system precrRNA processing endoribonuclease RAMP protein Cas6 [Rhodopirellula sp.]|nr:CRISPR system precrRNA processing endoribonuclease RAMP protein Cas6 [Rhodopirellula sp.]
MKDDEAKGLVLASVEPSATTNLSNRLLSSLNKIRILPRRLLLDTSGVIAAVPMLRGVWGAALHDLDADAYGTVFAPQCAGQEEASPLFVLRAARVDPSFGSALDWILIGDALVYDSNLRRAWEVACGMGLGPRRQRFHVRQVIPLSPDGTAAGHGDLSTSDAAAGAWSLDACVCPVEVPADSPCRLIFSTPLRLRRRGRLIEEPTLPDLIAAATRRFRSYLPRESQAAWAEQAREALAVARLAMVGPWRGTPSHFYRYSARQQADLDLHGVVGSLDLPQGPGELWPLLAAAQWLHLGKSTAMGLGQLCVETL